MEFVQPFMSGVGKFVMIHFNKIDTCRWTCMIFISHCQDIYCLSFHLKCEGMNFVAHNFKISKIIRDTNMITTKMNEVLIIQISV